MMKYSCSSDVTKFGEVMFMNNEHYYYLQFT